MIHRPPVPAAPRRAFTLIETLTSSALITIVLAAMGSVIVLSTQALPTSKQAGQGRLKAVRALEHLHDDLTHAIAVTDRSQTSLTLLLADRDDDGSSERVRYAWSGQHGSPLTRQFNDAEPIVLLSAVRDFTLDYHLQEHTHTHPAPLREGTEQTLAAYWPLELLDAIDSGATVSASEWPGQVFEPALDEDVVWWQPTKAVIKLREQSGGGPMWTGVVPVDAGAAPAYTPLAQGTIDTTGIGEPDSLIGGLLGAVLSPFDTTEIPFETVERIRPGEPLALVFRSADGTTVGEIGQASGSDRRHTTDAGQTWSQHSSALPFQIHGIPTHQGPEQQLTTRRVAAVTARLTSENEPTAPVETRVHLRNEPELLADHWALDFTRPPDSVDLLADGSADWEVEEEIVGFADDSDGSGGDADGIWTAADGLQTLPLHDFNSFTRVELRMQHAATGEEGAVCQIFADRTADDTAADLRLRLSKQSDGSQTLTLENTGHSDGDLLTQRPNLPPGFVNVELLIAPSHGTVHLRVDGRGHGTFAYQRTDATTSERYVTLYGDSGDAQFDRVRIRVYP